MNTKPKATTKKPEPKHETVKTVHSFKVNHNASTINDAIGMSVDMLNSIKADIIMDISTMKKSEALEYVLNRMNKSPEMFAYAAVCVMLINVK